MQDLRDKLRKAGLATKKEARKARTEKRRERKKKGGTKAEIQQEELKKQKFQAEQSEKKRAHREQQEQINRERAEQEQISRIENLIRSHAVLKIGGKDRRFYFVGGDRRIRRLVTSHPIADKLAEGQLAIVELRNDQERDFALVDAATAGRLEELEAHDRILFWNKDDEELPTYGAG